MTLNGFYGFFGDFGLQDIFQERISLKSLAKNRDNLRMKILAVVVTSLNFGPRAFKEFFRTVSSNLGTLSKCALSAAHCSSLARPSVPSNVCEWMNKNHRILCQLPGSVSLDFVCSGPSNMHRCRAFFCVSWAFLYFIANVRTCCNKIKLKLNKKSAIIVKHCTTLQLVLLQQKLKLLCKFAAPLFALRQIVPAESTSTTTFYFNVLFYFVAECVSLMCILILWLHVKCCTNAYVSG